MIIPVCQSFSALPEHQADWQTCFYQRTSLLKALSISGRILSQQQPSQHISGLTDRKTLAAVMVFYSIDCVPDGGSDWIQKT